jgi:hypothetical protein
MAVGYGCATKLNCGAEKIIAHENKKSKKIKKIKQNRSINYYVDNLLWLCNKIKLRRRENNSRGK